MRRLVPLLLLASISACSISRFRPGSAVQPAAPAPPAPAKTVVSAPVVPPSSVDAIPRGVPPGARSLYMSCKVPGKYIAMTYDDGPNPLTTPRLLDMLKERGIKATFFVVGQRAAASPSIVRRIVAEGHEVANHSWKHPNLSQMTDAAVREELTSTHKAIIAACGVTPTYYRPPYGAATLLQRKWIRDELGYVTVNWDVDPDDWRTPRSSTRTRDRILHGWQNSVGVHPGAIVLSHDIHKETVDCMPEVLDTLKAQGYQFLTVTQLMNVEAMSSTTAQRVVSFGAGAM